MGKEVSILESEYLPIICPVCGHKLEWEGVDLKCNNKECPNIKLSDLQQWCESVGETDGLQWTLMKQYLDLYGITDILKLYNNKEMVLRDLEFRKLSITELKVKEFFNKLYIENISIEKALIGLNVPRLGVKTAKLLATRKDLIYNLLLMALGQLNIEADNWTRHNLLELVKDATTSSIYENISKFETLKYTYYDNMLSSCRLVFDEPNNLTDKKYVAVTGALNTMKRKDFETYIGKFGYELTSNLKKCDYLITNTPNSGSSKNKDAQKYGVPLITEIEFINKLK